jgi:hypothetical protein
MVNVFQFFTKIDINFINDNFKIHIIEDYENQQMYTILLLEQLKYYTL